MKFGLLGKKISYSLSPKLHNIILNKIGVKGDYLLYDTDPLDESNFSYKDEELKIKEILSKIKSNELNGINVTQPYKEKIINYLDGLDEVAEKIGAVNTVTIKNGLLIGYNTDYIGILESIKLMKMEVKGKKIYILGTGGGSKSVIYVIKTLGGIPILISRDKKGDGIISYEELEKRDITNELLINTTPVNTPESLVKKFSKIFNLNYIQDEEIKQDEKVKKTILNGIYMLVVQGIEAQNLWQNRYDKNYLEIYTTLIGEIKK